MARYLVDTNHFSAMLHKGGPLLQRVQESLHAGNQFGTCVPVLCELEIGIRQTVRLQKNRKLLALLLEQIKVWPIDLELVPFYAETYAAFRGNSPSQTDIFVAAIARRMNATVLTTDGDFRALPDLGIEDWVTA